MFPGPHDSTQWGLYTRCLLPKGSEGQGDNRIPADLRVVLRQEANGLGANGVGRGRGRLRYCCGASCWVTGCCSGPPPWRNYCQPSGMSLWSPLRPPVAPVPVAGAFRPSFPHSSSVLPPPAGLKCFPFLGCFLFKFTTKFHKSRNYEQRCNMPVCNMSALSNKSPLFSNGPQLLFFGSSGTV